MTTLIINEFNGLMHPESKLNKADLYAEKASNALLQDGSLQAYPCPELVCEHDFNVQEIYESEGCECLAFDTPTYLEEFNNKIFVKERGKKAEAYCKGQLCDGEPCPISIPCPKAIPRVTAGTGGGKCNFSPSRYMYTFVSKSCWCVTESPPSPLSQDESCSTGATVSGFQAPPSPCVTHIRIYRFNAGYKTGLEKSVGNNSGALLVGEIPVGAASFNDNGSMQQSSMVGLVAFDMEAMPEDPDGFVASAFSFISWKGKELFISVPAMPHVRFASGRRCFDDNIIAVKYWRDSIYVFTERWNFRIDENVLKDGTVSYSDPPYRYENIAPILNEHSITVGYTGVFYVSKSGIGVLSGQEAGFVSGNIFNVSQWKSIVHSELRLHVYQQYLMLYSPKWDHTHLFEFEDNIYTDRKYSNHVTYPYSISAMYTQDSGDLLFAEGNEVYEFIDSLSCYDPECGVEKKNICQECCPYDYQIRPRHAVEITDYASAFLHIDPYYGDVTFTLWDRECGSDKVYEETFGGCGEHEFTLPAGCLSHDHTVQLTGCAKVYEMRLSSSHKAMGLNGKS